MRVIEQVVMRVLKRIPRWWLWTIFLLILFGGITSIVVASNRLGYGCLQEGSRPYERRVIDLNTSKIIIIPSVRLEPNQQIINSLPSPDSKKTALLLASNSNEWFIRVLDMGTLQGPTVALDMGHDLQSLSWSADGKYFFVYELVNGVAYTREVFDASTMQRVLSKPLPWATWSPQGHQLASFVLDNSNPGISSLTIFTPGQGEEQTVSLLDKIPDEERQENGLHMDWSPNGQYLTLSNNGQIWLYDVQKHTFKKAANDAYIYHAYGGQMVIRWTTYGNKLFYMANLGDNDQSLKIFDPHDWSSKILATRSPQANPSGFIQFSPDNKFALIARGGIDDDLPTYSILSLDTGQETVKSIGNGEEPNLIAWSANSNTMLLHLHDGLFWARTDGSQKHRINGSESFFLSYGNDAWIGYRSFRPEGNYPVLINLQTGDHHLFKDRFSDNFELFPAPDGQMAALIFAQQPEQHYVRMTLLSSDDKWSHTIEINSGGGGHAVWSPDGSLLALYTGIGNRLPTLHLLRADGTELRRIDNLPDDAYFDKWTNCG
jgi:WD40 repeat protein